MQATRAGLALVLLLAGVIAKGQLGPPPPAATTGSSQESLTLALARSFGKQLAWLTPVKVGH